MVLPLPTAEGPVSSFSSLDKGLDRLCDEDARCQRFQAF